MYFIDIIYYIWNWDLEKLIDFFKVIYGWLGLEWDLNLGLCII